MYKCYLYIYVRVCAFVNDAASAVYLNFKCAGFLSISLPDEGFLVPCRPWAVVSLVSAGLEHGTGPQVMSVSLATDG